jgi:hypothetical protein
LSHAVSLTENTQLRNQQWKNILNVKIWKNDFWN